jgi:hypothetical protein
MMGHFLKTNSLPFGPASEEAEKYTKAMGKPWETHNP